MHWFRSKYMMYTIPEMLLMIPPMLQYYIRIMLEKIGWFGLQSLTNLTEYVT